MTTDEKDGKGRGKRGKGFPGLTRADLSLWRLFTQDIKPFREEQGPGPEEESAAPDVPMAPPGETVSFTPPLRPSTGGASQSKEIDRRTEEKLRKGKMEIEARLDLHGYSQERAYDALSSFITAGHRRGLRCVLVITGKGRSGVNEKDEWHFNDGVLRQRVPQWLSVPPLTDVVLQYFTAQPKDGGEGAYYIYLRRQRDYSP